MTQPNPEQPNVPVQPNAEPMLADQPVVTVSGTVINYVLVAVTFLIVGVAIGAVAFGNRSGLTEASVEKIVRTVLADYNLSNEPNRFELVDNDPYLGAEDAPVVIVEFSDFRCPYCHRHFVDTLVPLLENYGEHIRYVYRHFAVLGPESTAAAIASSCGNEQGKFWEFHNTFFENQQSLGRSFYISVAEDNDLDVEAFTTCIDESRYLADVNSDIIDGQLNGVAGTPGFFINGTFVRGAQPYEVFERLVLRELAKANIEVNAPGNEG